MEATSIDHGSTSSRTHSPHVDVYLQETDLAVGSSQQLTPTTDGGVAGTLVMLIGAWLMFVALAGLQSVPWMVNTGAVGLIVCAANLWRVGAQPMRTLLRTLGPWLFASSLVLAHSNTWLFWNNLITAVALVALSFAKDLGRREARSMLTGA